MMGVMTSEGSKTSQRMCAGCGARTTSRELVRLVAGPSPPYVAVDVARRLGGRGVSVHAARQCVERALERGPLARLLQGVDVTIDRVTLEMVRQLDQRICGLLSAARRSRSAAVGTDAVRDSLSKRTGHLLLAAADARGRALEVRRMAIAIGCASATWGTKATLGPLFSRRELGVVLVSDRGIARAILECLTKIEALSEDE